MLELPSATVHKISTLSDKTIKIELFLRELTSDEMAALMSAYMSGNEGVKFEPREEEGRSQSQRLKGVLWHVWKQSGSQLTDDAFYIEQMEKIIQHYKDKLD